MERNVALKKLGKLLGKNLGYRVDNNAPTPEERTAAKASLDTAIKERDALKEKRDARYKAILAADVEYQNLHAAQRAASERTHQLASIVSHRKITVGTSHGMFFQIKAEGDSWEEVIEKLQAKEHVS